MQGSLCKMGIKGHYGDYFHRLINPQLDFDKKLVCLRVLMVMK